MREFGKGAEATTDTQTQQVVEPVCMVSAEAGLLRQVGTSARTLAMGNACS